MRRNAIVPGLTLLVLASCTSQQPQPGGTPAPSATPSFPATPAPAASQSPVPVHVRGEGTATKPSILTGTKSNRRLYTIRALVFEGDVSGSEDGVATLQQPHVTFVDKSGSVTVADAPKAVVKQRSNSIDMTGGVHARTAEGGILTCDDLRYDARTERFHGKGHVVVTSPSGLQLSGDHLDGDVRLHDVKVTSGGPG